MDAERSQSSRRIGPSFISLGAQTGRRLRGDEVAKRTHTTLALCTATNVARHTLEQGRLDT
jgi:hypothetical protein